MSFAQQATIMQRERQEELDTALLNNNLGIYRDALLKFGISELHDLELVPDEDLLHHCGLPPMAILRLRNCTSKRPKVRVFLN